MTAHHHSSWTGFWETNDKNKLWIHPPTPGHFLHSSSTHTVFTDKHPHHEHQYTAQSPHFLRDENPFLRLTGGALLCADQGNADRPQPWLMTHSVTSGGISTDNTGLSTAISVPKRWPQCLCMAFSHTCLTIRVFLCTHFHYPLDSVHCIPSPSHPEKPVYLAVYIVPISLVNEQLMSHCCPPLPELLTLIRQSQAFRTFN